MMRALGAEVVLVPQCPGSVKGQVSGKDLEPVEEKTRELIKERDAFRADQFKLDSSYRAHLLHTGEEIWEQSGGNVDCFIDFVGSGGTFEGCAEALKKHVGMENESASLLAQGTKGAAFYCQSSIGFGCYGNPVTLI